MTIVDGTKPGAKLWNGIFFKSVPYSIYWYFICFGLRRYIEVKQSFLSASGGSTCHRQESDMTRSNHKISGHPWGGRFLPSSFQIETQLMLSLEMDCSILLVGKPLVAEWTLESIFNSAFKPHVSVQIVVPVVTLSTLLALKWLSLAWLSSRLVSLFSIWTFLFWWGF